ncbi:DUF6653 family protein [Reinekea thalattae]|uniref:Uncharacterized protein n=1 Tax=Reinekea thalattae TaxID=2593301 RepID=A0A5C8ZBS5_9GAMM|nr:DUF6653 family protein [Reinekea thalattae]TXR54621.1 hypothetical protein FME95_08815 [Reinekea thalattae]
MDLLKLTEKSMAMNPDSWMRHANPISVYSRFTVLPLLTLAIYARTWLGSVAWLFVALVLLWTWLNPRLFSAPKTTDNWASMATFGERVYLNRAKESLIPKHHLLVCRILLILQLVAVPVWGYALIDLRFDWAIFTTAWLMVTKAWFVDRMVWIYMDVKDHNEQYAAWLKTSS